MNSEYKQIEKEILEKIKDYGLSIQQFKVLTKKAEDQIKKEMVNSDNYKPKEYWSLEMASFAYIAILENNLTANEAMLLAAEQFSKSKSWVEETKNNPFFYAKKLVDTMQNHPVQKRMNREGVFDIGVVKSAKTVNQQLRRVSRFKKLDQKLTELTEKLDKTEKEVQNLKMSDEEKSIDIDILYQNVNITKASVDEKILHLHKRGFTMVQIADKIGVSRQKVSRVIKKSQLRVVK